MQVTVEHAIAGGKRCRLVADTFRHWRQGMVDQVRLAASGLHNLRVAARACKKEPARLTITPPQQPTTIQSNISIRFRLAFLAWLALGTSVAVSGADPPPAAPVPILMQLDWKTNAQFAGLLLAKEKGYYAQAGLDVRIRPAGEDGVSVIKTVLDTPNAIGSAESSELLEARGKGAPIKAVATMFQGSPMALLSLEKTKITEVKDLLGKRIGMHGEANGHRVLSVAFADAGIHDPPYELKEIGYEMEELKSGAVDVAQGYTIDELVSLRTVGIPVRAMPMADHGYHAYSQVFCVSEEFLRRDPASIQHFLEASFRGWREAFADPEAAARMIVEKYQPGTDLKYETESLREIARLATRESPNIGQMSMASWEASAEMFRRFKFVESPAAASDLVNMTLLRAIYP